MQTSLPIALGWNDELSERFEPYEREGLQPARVLTHDRGSYLIGLADREERAVVPRGRNGADDLPVVGDWVAVDATRPNETAVIRAVLPRRTRLLRKEAGPTSREQALAANVDIAFIVTSLTNELNPRRLERYLTVIWSGGALPVIVLTKKDLVDDPTDMFDAVAEVAVGVEVHAVSNETGEGIDELDRYLVPGSTITVLGSSGVGKSSLINRLVGEEAQDVHEVSYYGKGKHTTTRRELVRAPGGVLLLDTPGMRELGLAADNDGVAAAFPDVEELAAACRFADCTHESEPGCAVLDALASGALAAERLAGYRKLQREQRAMALRADARARAEETRKRRRMARSFRRDSY